MTLTPESKQESDTPLSGAVSRTYHLAKVADLERQLSAVTAERDAAPEKESERWAERFNFLHTEYGADCSGTDSGDLLDLVEAEVWQALRKVEAERDALRVDAERWVRVVALWMASTEMSFKQDEDGMWSITQIEDVEGALFKPLKGDTPDAAIDAARAK